MAANFSVYETLSTARRGLHPRNRTGASQRGSALLPPCASSPASVHLIGHRTLEAIVGERVVAIGKPLEILN